MLRMLTDKPRMTLAFIYVIVFLALLLGGCESRSTFLETGQVTNILLSPLSGEGGPWPTLEDEYTDKAPILSGLPGAGLPSDSGTAGGDTSGGGSSGGTTGGDSSGDTAGGGSTGGDTSGGTTGGGSTGGDSSGGTSGGGSSGGDSSGGISGGGSPDGGSSGDSSVPPTNVSSSEALGCSGSLGTQASKIRVIHSAESVTITGDQPIALKVTGDNAKVTFNIVGESGKTLPGICLFAMGNQPDITINLGVALGGFYYRARGNQSKTVLQVTQLASLLSAFTADLSGNLASFIVWGQGKHICPALVAAGNNPSLTCTPN